MARRIENGVLRVGRSEISERVTRLKLFKTLSLFFLMMLFLLLCSGIVHGGMAPEFTLTDIDGNAFSLSDFRGKIVIIEFFSTTCGYCINEIPHLKAVHNEFGEGELAIISVSRSYNNNTQLINFRNEYQIPWIIARDTANVFQTYNVSGIPTLYLIDHEGVTAYHHQGVVEASALIAKVNELLTAHAAPPVISVLFPENKTYSASDVPLTFTVNGSTSWMGYSLDGEANATITGNTTLTDLLDGSHSVVVYANDTVGNMGTSNMVYFTVDTVSPSVEVLSPENKTYATGSVPLNFTVDEAPSWMGYSLDGEANATITGNTTLTSLLDGSHSVVVYANDTVGNMGASGAVYFTVDTTPPNITDVSQIPLENNVQPEDEVIVNATVIDVIGGVERVALNYTNGNGTWVIVEMTSLSVQANVWSAIIPSFPYGTNVTYRIIAEDNMNNTITTEDLGYEYQYIVVPEFPSLLIMSLLMIATLLAVIIYRKNMLCPRAP